MRNFIMSNREAIIARAQQRVASRGYPKSSDAELTTWIPGFLDRLGHALRGASSTDRADGEQPRADPKQGKNVLCTGLNIDRVAEDYGDVCYVVTEMALHKDPPISCEESLALDLFLDDAIADAVSEYARQRELAVAVPEA